MGLKNQPFLKTIILLFVTSCVSCWILLAHPNFMENTLIAKSGSPIYQCKWLWYSKTSPSYQSFDWPHYMGRLGVMSRRGGVQSSAFLGPGSSAAPGSPSEMPVAWQERGGESTWARCHWEWICTDLSWSMKFFDAAMKLDLESSHVYFNLPRFQQRCQPVPCRTWGMTPLGVLSCDRCGDGVDLAVVKMGWVSCWHLSSRACSGCLILWSINSRIVIVE